MEITSSIATLLVTGLVGLFVVVSILLAAFIVSNQTVKIVERFGKYHKTAHAGLNFKIPFVDTIRQTVSLKVGQHNVAVDTITKDKVSVRVTVAVNYNVLAGKEAEAYYKLDNPTVQIESFVFDVVRAQVPKLTLDDVFDSKDHIATAVRTELTADMATFGYEINKTLVTEIEPDAKVKAAMNDINAAQREREAANARGEAEKTLKVKAAEAQAESDRLRGKGLADQRIEIMKGLKLSAEDFKGALPHATDAEVMTMLMLTQYLEMIEKVGANARSNTIMIPHSPGGMAKFRDEILQAVASGNLVAAASTDGADGSAQKAS